MTEEQALEFAIEVLQQDAHMLESRASDWRRHGDALQFGKVESRMAAERCDRMYGAIAVLREILAREKR